MTALIVIHVCVCLALIGIILLQPGKGDMGIGFGSSSQSIFGSKGAGNFLTKATTTCAVLFLVLSYGITRLRLNATAGSVLDSIPIQEKAGDPGQPVAEPGHEGHDHAPGEHPVEEGKKDAPKK